MNEDELYEVLQSYKAALDALIDQNEKLSNEIVNLRHELTGRIDSVEKTLFDDILNPAKEAIDKAGYESRFDEFNAAYGEKLDPFVEQTKAIEGNDYDFKREVFDNYDKMEEKPDASAYIETVIDAVSNQIGAIKSALGAEEVKIKSDEDGKVEIEADGKDVTEEAEAIMENGKQVESEDDDKIIPDVEIEEGEASPEEIAALEEELSAYKK